MVMTVSLYTFNTLNKQKLTCLSGLSSLSDSLMYSSSSCDIFGCWVGESVIRVNQKKLQTTPNTPEDITEHIFTGQDITTGK